MMRILTVDDHEVVRRGVKEMFTETSATFGEAHSGAEALNLVREQNWDIVVLDISLGGRNGLEVLGEIKQLKPSLPVLILSMHAEEQYAVRAFKAGASGYINKASPGEELRRANSEDRQRWTICWTSARGKDRAATRASGGIATRDAFGSRTAGAVFNRFGKTVGEIAQKLSLSDKTISTYRRRILDKMDMKTNAELTHYAIRNGLV